MVTTEKNSGVKDMRLELDPPRGVGDLRFGMQIDIAERILGGMPGFVPPAPGERRNKGFAHYESHLSISLDFDSVGIVRGVEIFRPERDVQVVFQGTSVFEEPADIVISRLSQNFRLEIEDDGLNVVAPEVFIGLWRSMLPDAADDVSGRYFESVLVAAPGYGV
ncbi:hypothetical protein [Streptomyces graminilatus]|uniref:hypothetical protein n=1 Tax=Streptomyces graminilatus TaxID=1464070 RepID=UPI0012FED103|nr:hypothetical protein [Streptomyces graminilatus]